MIDPGSLVEDVLRGVLGVRPKRSRGALRFLTGRRRGGWMSNPNTLLTAAGVVWGIFETMNQPAPPAPGSGPGATEARFRRPCLPCRSLFPNDALRMVRLAISAANADGAMNDKERAAVVEQARASGTSELVAAELHHPRPLAEIVSASPIPPSAPRCTCSRSPCFAPTSRSRAPSASTSRSSPTCSASSPDEIAKLEADVSQRIESEGGPADQADLKVRLYVTRADELRTRS